MGGPRNEVLTTAPRVHTQGVLVIQLGAYQESYGTPNFDRRRAIPTVGPCYAVCTTEYSSYV